MAAILTRNDVETANDGGRMICPLAVHDIQISVVEEKESDPARTFVVGKESDEVGNVSIVVWAETLSVNATYGTEEVGSASLVAVRSGEVLGNVSCHRGIVAVKVDCRNALAETRTLGVRVVSSILWKMEVYLLTLKQTLVSLGEDTCSLKQPGKYEEDFLLRFGHFHCPLDLRSPLVLLSQSPHRGFSAGLQ